MTVRPRHVICLLGEWKSFDAVEKLIAKYAGWEIDREYSQLAADDRMPRAFEASGDRFVPLEKSDRTAIERHRAVAYVMGPRLDQATSAATSARGLALIAKAFETGATAAKCESSGIAHGAAHWTKLAKDAAKRTPQTRAAALLRAWVCRPINDGKLLYSCGMHLLGERDLEIAPSGDAIADVEWIDLVAIYLLAEKPERGVHDGEGFRPTADGERRVLRAKPCKRYASDDFFYNPYGYWRLATK
jgi:hypothetical protein